MEKYLFNDGTNLIREVQSREELDSLIATAPDRDAVRIWVFNTSEWLSYAAFHKTEAIPVAKTVITPDSRKKIAPAPDKPIRTSGWLKKALVAIATIAAIFLVYNFTKVKWEKLSPLSVSALRPDNVPFINADSLIQAIEFTRGQKLDKITRTNLRIRNTWPDRILLQLSAARDSGNTGIRFYDIAVSLDNATGYQLDEAVVEVSIWKNYEAISKDTIHLQNISYVSPAKRMLPAEYRGDSISVNFSSIKAKSFNFCYASDKQSNYGNLNDRWFCK